MTRHMIAENKMARKPQPRVDADDLRAQLGITQQEFATLLGLSTVTVSRWTQGRTSPTAESHVILELVSRALKRQDPDEVITRLRAADGPLTRTIELVHLGD